MQNSPASRFIDMLTEIGKPRDDPSFEVADSQAKIANELVTLKAMRAVGDDQKDIQGAIRYLEAGAMLLARVVQRNIQRRP